MKIGNNLLLKVAWGYKERRIRLTNNKELPYRLSADLNPDDTTVYKVLGYGKGNALTSTELGNIFGIRSKRQIQAIIHRERMKGFPIAAEKRNGECGYFIPETMGEVEEYAKNVKKQATSALASAKVFWQILQLPSWQIGFDDEGQQA